MQPKEAQGLSLSEALQAKEYLEKKQAICLKCGFRLVQRNLLCRWEGHCKFCMSQKQTYEPTDRVFDELTERIGKLLTDWAMHRSGEGGQDSREPSGPEGNG